MPSQAAILDAHYMARALELARKGLYTTHPNPRVGCVIVRDGEVVGTDHLYLAGWPLPGADAKQSTRRWCIPPCGR